MLVSAANHSQFHPLMSSKIKADFLSSLGVLYPLYHVSEILPAFQIITREILLEIKLLHL